MTNPTTAEKVREALNYFTGPGAAPACHEYAQDIRNHIATLTAELASLWRERDGLLTTFRDALVEEILAHPADKEVDAQDFTDAVMDRFDTARGAGNGRAE